MPRDGLGWTFQHHFFEDRLSNLSNFDEKRWGGFGFGFSGIGSRLPLLKFSDKSMLNTNFIIFCKRAFFDVLEGVVLQIVLGASSHTSHVFICSVLLSVHPNFW